MRPNSMNLDGIFALLSNVAWTSAGPAFEITFAEGIHYD
jgi:tetrahydrodipicolinate N-succinyltransferase